MAELYDVIIAGGGPAGLAAGLYAARDGLKALLIEAALPGGQIATTDSVENYPGFPQGVTGEELSEKMEQQAKRFGMEMTTDTVVALAAEGHAWTVKGERQEHRTRAVIIATGATPRKLGVAGEAELANRGVSYCATCDGPLFAGKKIMVVGGGNAAVEEADFLTRFVAGVTVIHRRDQLRASKVIQDRAFENEKIDFLWDSVVVEIGGEGKVEWVEVKNVKTGETSRRDCEGVFVLIGSEPNTGFLQGVVDLDEKGYVTVDREMRTSATGVFACGDVEDFIFRQAITSAGAGAAAAISASKYVAGWKE